jgi:two-component system CheB/CheR fusion protein
MTPVTERTLNLAPSDIGRPIGHLRLSVDVADLESLVREAGETLTAQEREVQARDDCWYSMRVRPYRTADNKIDGVVISFVDIDALKRGLDQAQAIVETVREPLVVLDADLRLLTANRSFYETFQVHREETERQSLLDLGNRQWDIPQLRAMLEGVLAEGKVFEGVEVEQDFDGIGKRAMLLNARRMLSATGRPAQILLAIEDVTERRRAERERSDLLVQRAEAEAATLAKDEFLAIVSHELRTPLTAVLGWTRMLRTQKLDEAGAARALEVIERNAVLQVRLIEDLLDVSRIVSGTMRVETRLVMVTPAIHATLTSLQPAAEAKGVVLQSALDENAGPVRGDPARLQQIVWNLVFNAIKFTPSGGRVDVRVARLASAVEISVRDTGRGIAAEQLPQIFNRFRIAHTSTQPQEGMGLGLSIVRNLVELHGGSVRAESPGPGQGATFTVNLPLTDDRAASETEISVIASKRESGQHPALEGVRVLVVDDEADARELLRAVLAQCGADVTVAANVRAALEALERVPFDVLVSDIVMPDEDGYDLIRNVRARGAERGGHIPALAVTAYARIEDRTAAIAAGYQQHAAKPIDPGELAAAVATLVGRGK